MYTNKMTHLYLQCKKEFIYNHEQINKIELNRKKSEVLYIVDKKLLYAIN